jgi:hypothetical protein
VATLLTVSGAFLEIDPGALVCFGAGAGLLFQNGAGLVAGAALPSAVATLQAEPGGGRWYGIILGGAPSSPDSLTNVELDNADAAISGSDPVYIADSYFQGSGGIYLSGPFVRILRTTFDGTGLTGGSSSLLLQLVASTNSADIIFSSRVINAPGVAVATYGPGILLTNCDIHDSGGDAVKVGQSSAGLGTTQITNCNLTFNSGLAVNAVAGTATADQVWWGTAACPGSSPPNGISTGVTCTNPLSAPASLGYSPPAAGQVISGRQGQSPSRQPAPAPSTKRGGRTTAPRF